MRTVAAIHCTVSHHMNLRRSCRENDASTIILTDSATMRTTRSVIVRISVLAGCGPGGQLSEQPERAQVEDLGHCR